MAKIIDSLKNLNVENGTKTHEKNQKMWTKNKLSLSMNETLPGTGKLISSSDDYVVSISGTELEGEIVVGVVYSGADINLRSSKRSEIITTCKSSQDFHRSYNLRRNQCYFDCIIGMKFSTTFTNMVYQATCDGRIIMLDMRTDKPAITFEDDTEDGKKRSVVSFDVSCNDRLIAAGTEHTGGDAFILFWDIRYGKSMKKKINNKIVGGYWESHTDDITCLSFNPVKSNFLASGSTDGLINIFDLTQPSEDEALMYSLNTESSVDKLGWSSDDSLWCMTHTHALQLWDCEGASPYAKFERNNLAVSPYDNPDDCYLVRYHPTSIFGLPFLLAGCTTDEGERLRCFSFANNRLEMCNELIGNTQVVRESWLHEKSGTLWTTGEKCIVNVWREKESEPGYQENSGHQLVGKISTQKDQQHRVKPY